MNPRDLFRTSASTGETVLDLPSSDEAGGLLSIGRIMSAVFAVGFSLGALSQAWMTIPALLFGLLTVVLHIRLKQRDRLRPRLVLTPPGDATPPRYTIVRGTQTVTQGSTGWRTLRVVPTVFPGGYMQSKRRFTLVLMEPSVAGIPPATTVDLGDRVEPCLILASSPFEKEMQELLKRLQGVLGAPEEGDEARGGSAENSGPAGGQ